MFDYSHELLDAQELERIFSFELESRWLSVPKTQREQITELVEQMKSHGAICSEYDFI